MKFGKLRSSALGNLFQFKRVVKIDPTKFAEMENPRYWAMKTLSKTASIQVELPPYKTLSSTKVTLTLGTNNKDDVALFTIKYA